MTICACGNCRFYDTQSKAAASAPRNEAGLCRYNPPLPQGGSEGVWPVVESKDWCGHFAATVDRFMTAAE